jgi:hypothetical protein
MISKTIEPGLTWEVQKDLELYVLNYKEGGKVVAPEGKQITMTINGVGTELVPGYYKGDIRLMLTDIYDMTPHGLRSMAQIHTPMNPALVIRDNAVDTDKSATILLQGGSFDGNKLDGTYMATTKGEQNGVIVEGDSTYEITGAQFDMEGFASCDFVGSGAAVTAIDNANVTIRDSEFNLAGVTRCAIHVGGESTVNVENCKLINMSPDSDKVDTFSWMVGFTGTNRLVQLTDHGRVNYTNCELRSNGWAISSIDGGGDVHMVMKDCYMELTGPRSHGYGAFCIGDNTVTYDHTHVKINGFPILVMGEDAIGRAAIINGSVVEGRRFGVMVHKDDNSIITLKDSSFKTGKSVICSKGSASTYEIDNVTMEAGNNVILQLMDNDETDMCTDNFYVPVGVKDEYVEGRDLSEVSETEDVVMHISNSTLKGDFFNSTTEIRQNSKGVKGDAGMFMYRNLGAVRMDGFGEVNPHQHGGHAGAPEAKPRHKDDLQGAKNLGLYLANVQLEGIVSSATQAYREGLFVIEPINRLELSNVTQTAAPTVNNGVVVTLDEKSAWTVTGTSYITGLTLAKGAVLAAPAGKTLTMTVDGVETAVAPGAYTGKIVLTVA